MKAGKSLVELAQEIERQAEAKKDFIAPVSKLAAKVDEQGGVKMELDGQGAFPLTPYAHGQMAEYLEIPRKYYERMRVDAPEILSLSVNRWLSDHSNERRMIRTMDGNMRALLSDRYRSLDHEDLAEAVLPVLKSLDLMILSAEITEKKFYIKAVDRSITRDIPTGAKLGEGHTFFDTVSPAISISNSEIGAGRLLVETSIFTKMCTNLATLGAVIGKYHTGSRADISEEVYALLSDRTKSITDQAFWNQIRDLVKAAFDEARFAMNVKKLEGAVKDEIKDSPVQVLEKARKRFSWTEAERDSVLTHLIKGGDLTRYGLHSAVTRAAEDFSDYDRATEFERLGGEIIELDRKDWELLAIA